MKIEKAELSNMIRDMNISDAIMPHVENRSDALTAIVNTIGEEL